MIEQTTLQECSSMTRKPTRQPISEGSEWTFDLLGLYDKEIGRVAAISLGWSPNGSSMIPTLPAW